MKPENIKIPWGMIGQLVAKLIKSAKGGIDKNEAEDLLGDLADIVTFITIQLGNK